MTKSSGKQMIDRAALPSMMEVMANARVLCVGDLMLDRYVYGEVSRISPEAPIPVLRVARDASMLGGAGNVVRNLAALGARGRFLGVVGDDPAGREVSDLIAAHDSVPSTLIEETGRPTSIKTRFIAGTQQMMRADREETAPIAKETRDRLLQTADIALGDCEVLVLSDYGKGVLIPAVIEPLVAKARASGKPVIVDPKGEDYSVYRGADLVTPNRNELAAASRMPVESDGEIAAAAEHISRTCGIRAVLVTRSREGMTLVTPDQGISHLATEAREVYDVSGAGDTVVATLAAALSTGADLARAAALANVAAGIVVGKVGTAVAYAEEITAALHERDRSAIEAKRLSQTSALDLIARWRRQGLRVGFTNGCFDLLHPGHVTILNRARETCDRLVVGLNSDASVSRLKGKGRPIQPEMARAAVLASLTSVDAVVSFEEDTPQTLIKAIRPDVLVKGADYRVEDIAGADFVQSYGGRVILIELEPGHSTSDTIARINGTSG